MRIFLVLFLIEISLFSVSCKKSTAPFSITNTTTTLQKGITYPDSISFGKNILSLTDTARLVIFNNYDIGAILQKDASLQIVFTNLVVTDTLCAFEFISNTGWIIDNKTPIKNATTLIFKQTGTINLQFIFYFIASGSHSKMRIDFYENSNSITHTTYVKW